MSTNAKQPRKRRRPSGVPTALVIVLIAIAIVMGGLLGFVVARRTAPADDRLARANERIIELENTLNLIGFPVDGNPEEFIFDDSAQSNGAADLAGEPESAGSETEAWTEEDTLLNGTLDENADPVVVAEFDGGQLLSTEVIPEFNDQLTTQVFDGYNADEVADSVLQTVLSDMAGQKLIAMKAAELGLDQITDADLQAINAEADAEYKNQIRYYTAFAPDAYDPATGLFFQQDTETGDYLWGDAFINLQVKRASIYVKAGHINALWESTPRYFLMPHYPGNRFGLFWGMTWNFFD